MVLAASNISELVEQLANGAHAGERVSAFALHPMNRVLEYTPEDMTVTVEAGITLAELQRHLAERGQWLPVDPPRADTLTIGALLAANKSGPRRYGYGTIREHLLGIKVVLADGRVIKAGGKVVKNVAGYDLCKLFVGSRGTLGVIVDATFKVLPRPEKEELVKVCFAKARDLGPVLEKLNASELTPVIIDLHNQTDVPSLVVGFAGAREDVDWQLAQARELGLSEPATLAYDEKFWSQAQTPHSVSILPSKVIDTVRSLDASFVARSGNGVIYYRGGPAPACVARASAPAGSSGVSPPEKPRRAELMRRIKDTYDPKHLLPELPW